MRIETYLNALCLSKSRSNDFDQFNKFFDRILMKFDEKEMLIQLQHMKISSQRERIAELEAELKAKAWVDRPMRDPTERYELTNEEWSKP